MFAKSGLMTAPLRRPLLGLDQATVLEHTCLSATSAIRRMIRAIADPVLDEPDQPVLADRVEERPDVGVEDPVDPLLADPERERVQRIVLATLRVGTRS